MERLTTPVDSLVRHAVPAMVVVLFVGFWLVFVTLGRTAAVDTHFTRHPEQHPEFSLTPWQAAPGEMRHTRQAVLPLTFFTLRYTQASPDGGRTTEVVRYDADVRWGPVLLGMVASGAGAAAAYLLLGRLIARLLYVPAE